MEKTNIVQLHDRITVTLSAEATRLIREIIQAEVETEDMFERSRNRLIEKWKREEDELDQEWREMGIELTPQAQHKPYQKRAPKTPEALVNEAIDTLYGYNCVLVKRG